MSRTVTHLPAIAGIAVFLFTWTLTTHGKYSVSGDEPHYLIIIHSIITDHDLDLANNYAQNDGRFFGHDGLERGPHAVPSRTGHVRSVHNVGLAVALLPAYVAAQRIARIPSDSLLRRIRMTRGLFAYSIVSLFLMVVTAIGLALVASGSSAIAQPRHAAALVALAGISPPIVSHAFLVFPESAALFVTSVAVWLSIKQASPRDPAMLLVLFALLGALPWLHHKYVVYAPGLLCAVAFMRWGLLRTLSTRWKATALMVFVAPQAALHAVTWHEWGTLAGALAIENVPFSWNSFQAGAVGLWFDRQSGLLAYAPLYWIVPACWWITRRETSVFLLPVALLYLPAAAFVVWWAGFAPAARYIAPAAPLLLLPLVYALRYSSIRRTLVLLSVPQLIIDGMVWQHPRWLWPAGEGNRALQSLGTAGTAYESLLPGVQTRGVTLEALWVVLGAIALSVLVVALVRQEQRARLRA